MDYGLNKTGFVLNTLLSARIRRPWFGFGNSGQIAPLTALVHPMPFDKLYNLNMGESTKRDELHIAPHSAFLDEYLKTDIFVPNLGCLT